jgi:hypothetical protein
VPALDSQAEQHGSRPLPVPPSPADRPRRRQRAVTAGWLADATRGSAAARVRTAARVRRAALSSAAHTRTSAAAGTSSDAESFAAVRILVVADETPVAEPLIKGVRARAARGPCAFTLVVPSAAHGLHRLVDPEDQETDEAHQTLSHALPLLEQAAGASVVGMVGDPTALTAAEDAINAHGFDELIVYTRPARMTRWLRLDLPSKISCLGMPTTTVYP